MHGKLTYLNYLHFVPLEIELQNLKCFMQIVFGALLLVHLPHLNPFPGYIPLRSESVDDKNDETILGEDHICPERYASILSSQWILLINFNHDHLILKWFHTFIWFVVL